MPRFLSIMTMVALGVMFLVGLRSAAPDMRATADRYFDRHRLFDLQLFSTVGFGQADLDALSALEGVEACVGAQSLDGTLTYRNTEKVIKLHSLTTDFNVPELVEGRLPEAAGECAVDARLVKSLSMKPGVSVDLRAALEGTLCCDTYKVVGIVKSPLYISLDRGTSTLGDGSVAGFVLLPEEGFSLDYATVVYLRVCGAADLDAYSNSYKQTIRKVSSGAEALAERLAADRYLFLKEDGARQLSEGETELASARKEADQRLSDAERALQEGRISLDKGWEELAQGKEDYETGSREGRKALDDARDTLDANRSELAAAELKLNLGKAALTLKRQLYRTNLATARESVVQAEERAAKKQNALREAEDRAAAAHAEAERIRKGVEANLRAALFGQEQNPEDTIEALAAALAKAALEDALVEAAQQSLRAAEQNVTDSRAALEQTRSSGAQQLAAAEAELTAGEAAITAGRAQIEAGDAEFAAAEKEYAAKLNNGAKALEAAEAELLLREQEYAQGLLELDAARADAETAFAESREALDRAARRLEALRTPETYVLDRNSNYGFVSYDQNAQRMSNLARMFPVIFYLVAALVCLTTMTRMVEEQRTQIGAIKAMGYGTWSIAGKYLLYGALASVLGAILGAAVGTVLIPWVIFFSYAIMYDLPQLTLLVNWPLCFAALGIGLAVTLGATLWAMLATARQTPAALLRPRAPKPGKRILLERVKPIWNHMNFSMKVSARNLFRFKKRLFMTVIGVMGCTALLIAGLGLHTSIFDILDVQFFDLYQYDVLVTVDSDSPDAAERIEAFLASRGETDVWTGVYNRSVSFSGDGQSVEGYVTVTADPEALKKQIVLRDMETKKELDVPADGALIDLKLAELLQIDAGDELQTDVGGRIVRLPVNALREHYVYHYAIVSAQTYSALTGEDPLPNEYMVRLKQNDEDSVSVFCKTLMQLDGVQSVQNKAAMARSFRKTMQAVDAAVTVIFLSAAALAFVVLFNLTNINVTERIRELATIKVLGFYDPELAMYVFRENIILTGIGIILGQFFGKYLLAFLIRTVEMDIVMFGRDPQLQNYLFSVLLSLFFAALVNVFMYFRIRKIDMVQALKSVE